METAIVQVSVAPVLAARRVTSEQVTQALLGARVAVLERGPRWARIRMEDDYEGWVSTGHLARPGPDSSEAVIITELWVNLRTQPDYRMPPRAIAFIGTCLPLRQRQPGWYGLGLPAGPLAWLEEHRGRVNVSGAALKPLSPQSLVATARRFLGTPYLWGGCSPFGLDCSGFVQLVYRLHGVALPRDADQQAAVGDPVPLVGHGPEREARLAAGDAVFFNAPGAPEQISHVGLALGDGEFIHAAGSDAVRLNRLTDPPYGERLASARRYSGSTGLEPTTATG